MDILEPFESGRLHTTTILRKSKSEHQRLSSFCFDFFKKKKKKETNSKQKTQNSTPKHMEKSVGNTEREGRDSLRQRLKEVLETYTYTQTKCMNLWV